MYLMGELRHRALDTLLRPVCGAEREGMSEKNSEPLTTALLPACWTRRDSYLRVSWGSGTVAFNLAGDLNVPSTHLTIASGWALLLRPGTGG